jgi:hypothetical protein
MSVDDMMEEMGFDPSLPRSNFLPYNKEAGLHIPELLYQPLRAITTAGAAARGVPVSPEEAMNVAGMGQMGAFGGANPGGMVAGMGNVTKFPGPKKPPTQTHLENIKESLTGRLHSGELTWEDWLDAMDPISKQIGHLEKAAREKEGLGKIQPIWGNMNQIPEGTNVIASHGLSNSTPVKAKVVGGKWVQFESGLQYVPLAEFPDGKRRYLAPSNIHEVMTPTLASSNKDPQLSPRRLNILFDPESGIGAVPNNQDVHSLGRVEYMRPSEFLGKAWPMTEGQKTDKSMGFLSKSLKEGKKLGNPFLDVEADEVYGPLISGHEGRHRVTTLQNKYGDDVHIPVHMFGKGAARKDVRAGNIKMEDTKPESFLLKRQYDNVLKNYEEAKTNRLNQHLVPFYEGEIKKYQEVLSQLGYSTQDK